MTREEEFDQLWFRWERQTSPGDEFVKLVWDETDPYYRLWLSEPLALTHDLRYLDFKHMMDNIYFDWIVKAASEEWAEMNRRTKP